MAQGRAHLELVVALADQQEHDDPFSSWRDVGLHAQLAAAHVDLLVPTGGPDARPTPAPSSSSHIAGETLENPTRRAEALLGVAEQLLNTDTAGCRVEPSRAVPGVKHHLLNARLEMGKARTYLAATVTSTAVRPPKTTTAATTTPDQA